MTPPLSCYFVAKYKMSFKEELKLHLQQKTKGREGSEVLGEKDKCYERMSNVRREEVVQGGNKKWKARVALGERVSGKVPEEGWGSARRDGLVSGTKELRRREGVVFGEKEKC